MVLRLKLVKYEILFQSSPPYVARNHPFYFKFNRRIFAGLISRHSFASTLPRGNLRHFVGLKLVSGILTLCFLYTLLLSSFKSRC